MSSENLSIVSGCHQNDTVPLAGRRAGLNYLLLTTADTLSDRLPEVGRLLDSVDRSRAAREGRVTHILLWQRAKPGDALPYADRYPWLTVLSTPDRVALSKARNMLLAHPVAAAALAQDGIVAYPDDDAWYPDGFLEKCDEVFSGPDVGLFFCRYASKPTPVATEHAAVRTASLPDVVAAASSNTIILRTAVAARIGGFDERLGVGTEMGSGEDTDYAFRAFCAAKERVWIDARLVGHRDPVKEMRVRYFNGDLFVLARYATSLTGLRLFGRKALVGIYYLATRRMAVSQFRAALSRALGEWVSAVRRSDAPVVSP